MKDPADKVTVEMFSKEEKLNRVNPISFSVESSTEMFTSLHGKMPSPASWEEAIDQVVDERNELLDMLEKVLATGWELGACIKAQTLVHTLRRQDAAREAEFSNNEKGEESAKLVAARQKRVRAVVTELQAQAEGETELLEARGGNV